MGTVMEVKRFFRDTAEVARRAGVPASTPRLHEGKGLIAPLGRQGLRCRYAPGVLDQLALAGTQARPAPRTRV